MKKTLSILLLLALPNQGPATGIPVFDAAALTESIKHGLEQIQQYTTQVSQLETEINNYKLAILQATGIASAAQIWQDVQRTYGQVMGTFSSVEAMGKNFQDLNYWIASANQVGTSQAAIQNSQNYWSTAQKNANTQLAQTITQQGQELQSDAATLQQLQSQAGGAVGTNQALGVMNEMSALMSKQLMSMRTLMLSDQQALAASNGATATNQQIQQATTQQYYSVQLGPQNHTGW